MEDITQAFSDEYYDFHEIKVDPGQSMLRIDKYLCDRLTKVSRNRIQSAIKVGAVRVNQMEVKPNYKVRPGDKIDMVIPGLRKKGTSNLKISPWKFFTKTIACWCSTNLRGWWCTQA